MISLTIDGKTVEVAPGTTILNAARSAGITIPTLCDHPNLTPYGGCRLCVVEVQGFRIPVASCTMPVNQGMVVKTNTEKLLAARRFLLTLLFSERNHFCPFCQLSGGDCELQNAAYDAGMTHWPIQPKWINFPVDTTHPYFVLDNHRCITCRRCVRACSELVGNNTLNFSQRGIENLLVADSNRPLGESSCISCGNCVQVCPTGALIDRVSAYQGHEKSMETTQTVCVGCSVGCMIKVYSRNNQIIKIEGDWDGPVNKGILCKTGRYLSINNKSERITSPMIRMDGKLKPTNWDEALWAVADRFKPLLGKQEGGVAALASTRLPVECLALFKNLFAEKFNSAMVTSIEEGRPTALQTSFAEETGQPFEGRMDVLKGSDCILVIGVDLVRSHEVVGFFVKRAISKGMKLIVIDPKENGLDPFAHFMIKISRGNDLDLILGLQAAVIKEGLSKTTPPPMEANKVLSAAAGKTGVSTKHITHVARLLANARKPAILYGKGITSQNDVETLRALVKFARLAGVITSEYSGLISLKGEANSLAATQLGLDQPYKLNGHKAVYLALGDDFPSQRLIQNMENAPFMVVQASYFSKLTEKADVVLPVEIWAEQDGHYINLDGRIQEAHHSVHPSPEIWANRTVLTAIADHLNISLSVNWKDEILRQVSSVAISEN